MSSTFKGNNNVINYLEEEIKSFSQNRLKTEKLISKLGKFDEKFLTKQSSTAHNTSAFDCLYYLVKPEVLIEKIGNKNKGMFVGSHVDYGNLQSDRIQHKEDTNIYNMWVKGEIQGSVMVTSQAGFVSNLLTNETFFGCHYDKLYERDFNNRFR